MMPKIYLAVFVIGLVLFTSGFGLYLAGPVRTVQPETVDILSEQVHIPADNWVTWKIPSKGILLFVDNASLLSEVNSASGRIIFHVMNGSQYSDWGTSKNSTHTMITQTIDIRSS